MVPMLIWFLACSSVYDAPIPTDASAITPEMRAQIQELPEDEKQLLLRFMMRREMGKAFGVAASDPLGITVGEALRSQKQVEAEEAAKEAAEKALAEQVELKKAGEAKVMNESMTVAVTSMEFIPSDFRAARYEDGIAVSIAFANKSGRDIAGVKGRMQFNDMFGSPIKSVVVAWDEGVETGQVAVWNASLGYNQFMDDDKKLANTPLEKMKVAWTPEMILFADGSQLPPEGAQ